MTSLLSYVHLPNSAQIRSRKIKKEDRNIEKGECKRSKRIKDKILKKIIIKKHT